LRQGAVIAALGIVVGAIGGLLLVRLVGGFIQEVDTPGLLPIAGAAVVLAAAAVLASVVPAARAARIDVVEALRSQ
jgi:ABC-type antimicrobial peptide transport system permease subunit